MMYLLCDISHVLGFILCQISSIRGSRLFPEDVRVTVKSNVALQNVLCTSRIEVATSLAR